MKITDEHVETVANAAALIATVVLVVVLIGATSILAWLVYKVLST